MKPRHQLLFTIVLSLFIGIPLPHTAYSSEGHSGTKTSEDMEAFFEGASKDNGYKIFHVGRNASGKPIKRKGGPQWLYMHGGACASCHGNDGQGGMVPMMCSTMTPPITLKALMSAEHEHSGTDEHHPPYTIKTIRRALEESVNSARKPLSPCMPKWFLSDEDFRDLLYQLKELE